MTHWSKTFDFDAADKRVSDEVDRLNAAWRNRTPEQIAAHNHRQMMVKINEQLRRRGLRPDLDVQFDAEREADEQHISMSQYQRERR